MDIVPWGTLKSRFPSEQADSLLLGKDLELEIHLSTFAL